MDNSSRDHDLTTTAKPKLTAAEILTRAADLLEPEGAWVQWVLSQDEFGNCGDGAEMVTGAVCWCAGGALQEAAGFYPIPATRYLYDTIGTNCIPEWNDAPERTQAEVVAALREAAALAREAEASDGSAHKASPLGNSGRP